MIVMMTAVTAGVLKTRCVFIIIIMSIIINCVIISWKLS